MSRLSLVPVVASLAFLLIVPAHADWPRFRGPNGSGVSQSTARPPTRWSPTANLKWTVALPGAGVSSPIVVGDRVYVTCYSGYGLDAANPGDPAALKRHLVSVDRSSGRIVWTRTVDAVLPEDPYSGIGVPAHGYASHTPVSDGATIVAFFGKTGAVAFDRDGHQLWQTSVGTESDPRRWGSASSPILYKQLAIVPATAESEAMVALDKKTGKVVWRQEARGLTNSWSTPVLVQVNDQRTDLILGVASEIWGLNPETGRLRWYCKGPESESFQSSVVAADGVIYAIEGRNGGSIAVRAGGKGDVTATHVVWTGRERARFGTPVVHGNHLYSFNDGIVSALDIRKGERVGRARLTGYASGDTGGGRRMGGDYASPIVAGNAVYYQRFNGDVFVVEPGAAPRQLAVNRVTTADEQFGATPAAEAGQLFIRSNKHLYCVADLGQAVAERPPPAAAPAEAGDDGADPARPRGSRGDRGAGDGRGGRRGGGFDPAEMFNRRDTDGDGKLSGEELPGRMRDRLADLDSDKDGAVSRDEFQKGMGRMFGGPGGRRGGGRNRGGDAAPKPERPQRPPLED